MVPWEAFIIGLIGGIIACSGTVLFDRLKIDDPVGAISVHGLGGIWVSNLDYYCRLFYNI